MLDWAEHNFPSEFPKSVAVRYPAVVHGGVTYNARHYMGSGGSRYLGITQDGRVFGLGDFTGGVLTQFNDIGYWSSQVLASLCREGSQSPATCLDAVPVAHAGPPQSGPMGSVLTLDGSASTDANGEPLTYSWALTSRPLGSRAVLNSPTSVTPTILIDMPGRYMATLTVSDGKLESASATVVSYAAGRIPDSGATGSMCYAAGSSDLVSCSSTAARALSEQQDGMVGLDASSPDGGDGKLGFSYTKLDPAGRTLPSSATAWACLRDNVTGLTWEVKTAESGLRNWGSRYTNFGDSRIGDSSEFASAVNTTSLCGFSDWRVPDLFELLTIVDYSRDSTMPPYKAAIDFDWFINTMPENYWASTSFARDPALAWNVDFRCGTAGVCFRSTKYPVRLVRGALAPEEGRYTFSVDGSEVMDNLSGLVWRRCSEGMTWDGQMCTGVAAAYSHEVALFHAKTQAGWRLPNVKELASIVDLKRALPAIDPLVFPGTQSDWYWSSSPMVGDPRYAWVVSFDYGMVFGGNRDGRTNSGGTKAQLVFLRLVRDGWSQSPTSH